MVVVTSPEGVVPEVGRLVSARLDISRNHVLPGYRGIEKHLRDSRTVTVMGPTQTSGVLVGSAPSDLAN